jgi:hypothetical protein
MGFWGNWARDIRVEEAWEEAFDGGVERLGVVGLLEGDPTLSPALGAFPANEFPMFWVLGLDTGVFLFVCFMCKLLFSG